MPALSRLCCSLLLLALACTVIAGCGGQSSPAEKWINLLQSEDSQERIDAAKKLGELGNKAQDAIPALVAASKTNDEPLVVAAYEALWRIRFGLEGEELQASLLRGVKDDNPVTRQQAAETLGRLKQQSKDAVPVLLELLASDPDMNVRIDAAFAVSQIGGAPEQLLPTLTKALSDKEFHVRREVSDCLGSMGAAAASAVPALAQALSEGLGRDGDLGFSFRAQYRRLGESIAWALGQIGSASAEAVPALIKALADEDAGVREAAAAALGQIGPGAVEAVPALVTASHDPDIPVRRAVAGAFGRIKSGDGYIEILTKMLSDADPVVRANATEALTAIRPDDEQIKQAVAASSTDENAVKNAIDPERGKDRYGVRLHK